MFSLPPPRRGTSTSSQPTTPGSSSTIGGNDAPYRPTLTAEQSLAHAWGRFSTWNQAASKAQTLPSREPSPTGSRRRQSESVASHTGSVQTSQQAATRAPKSKKKTSSFRWGDRTPGSAIYDPDYPDGPPPELCRPRNPVPTVGSSSSSDSWPKTVKLKPEEGDLTVSEIGKFGTVGTIEDVWGPPMPKCGICTCERLGRHRADCPLHVRARESGPGPKPFDRATV